MAITATVKRVAKKQMRDELYLNWMFAFNATQLQPATIVKAQYPYC